jgi:hypothetical protein
VNMVMNLQFLKTLENPSIGERLAVSQELVNLLSFMFMYYRYKPITTELCCYGYHHTAQNQQLFCLQTTVRLRLLPVKYSSSTRRMNVVKGKVVPVLN